MRSINPSTGQLIHLYEEPTGRQVRQRLELAGNAFADWSRTTFEQRAAVLNRVAEVLRGQEEADAHLMALEMGKPLAQGKAEIIKCASACDYFATQAERLLRPEEVLFEPYRAKVAFRPLGPVLAIMPWNFPFWQAFRAIAPALMAGNVVVLKHASNVPGCALAIEKIFAQAGAPRGICQVLLVPSAQVPELIKHPSICGVTLTGSTPAGAEVSAQAGAVLKKTVLELGGSDPYLVLEDADLEAAAETCAASRLINSGQSCIAAKRFIVHKSVRSRFESLLVERLKERQMGDPLEQATTLGPLARPDLRDFLHQQVQGSVAHGAKLLVGGEIPPGPGAFYPPTVLSGVHKGMPVYDEETFGPVAAVIEAGDEQEAVRIANDSSFGLGAAVFSRDRGRAERIALEELEAGCCFVNDFVRSDPRLPFGGIKMSGYGRELSAFGIREFVNIKTVCSR